MLQQKNDENKKTLKIRRRDDEDKWTMKTGKERRPNSNFCGMSTNEILKKISELLEEVERRSRNVREKRSETPINGRCYNCGSFTHRRSHCPWLEKGPRCFKCGTFGHVATTCFAKQKQNCLGKEQLAEKQSGELNEPLLKKMMKEGELLREKLTIFDATKDKSKINTRKPKTESQEEKNDITELKYKSTELSSKPDQMKKEIRRREDDKKFFPNQVACEKQIKKREMQQTNNVMQNVMKNSGLVKMENQLNSLINSTRTKMKAKK